MGGLINNPQQTMLIAVYQARLPILSPYLGARAVRLIQGKASNETGLHAYDNCIIHVSKKKEGIFESLSKPIFWYSRLPPSRPIYFNVY